MGYGGYLLQSPDGKVGIGTTAPDVRLHIKEDNATAVVRLERNDTTISTDDIVARLEVEGQDAGAAGICATIEAIAEGNDGETAWRWLNGVAGAAAEVMRLNYIGYLGIGTAEPDARLHIEDVTGAVHRFTRKDTAVGAGDVIGRMEFETQDSGNAGIGAVIQAEGEGTNGEVALVLQTGVGGAAVERMRIKSDGDITVGTASTNTLTMTSRFIPRTAASDPQDATPANRPAGSVGEIAFYNGKWYGCTSAATPAWEKFTST